tara:strand:- start:12110 stop:12901 length:792 start_codon:yes stop_codon:yes gene_type:complete
MFTKELKKDFKKKFESLNLDKLALLNEKLKPIKEVLLGIDISKINDTYDLQKVYEFKDYDQRYYLFVKTLLKRVDNYIYTLSYDFADEIYETYTGEKSEKIPSIKIKIIEEKTNDSITYTIDSEKKETLSYRIEAIEFNDESLLISSNSPFFKKDIFNLNNLIFGNIDWSPEFLSLNDKKLVFSCYKKGLGEMSNVLLNFVFKENETKVNILLGEDSIKSSSDKEILLKLMKESFGEEKYSTLEEIKDKIIGFGEMLDLHFSC